MPTSSYAPELFALFRKASVEEVTVKLPTKKSATALRFRMHKLRAEMRIEDHYMTLVANGVTISIREQPDGTAHMVVKPSDNQYLDAIKEAGVSMDDIDAAITEDEEEEAAEVDSPYDTFFGKDTDTEETPT